jgi:hypothetical protein
MISYTQASLGDVFAAGLVRLTQFGVALIAEEGRRVPDAAKLRVLEDRLINLRLGLEAIALESDLVKRDVLLAHFQEVYLLREASEDPLLRAIQPPLPATGGQIRRGVLGVNKKALRVNGALIAISAELVLSETGEVAPAPDTTTPVTPPTTGAAMTLPYTTKFTNQLSVMVVHNLGRPVNLQALDLSGQELDGQISSTPNTITIVFSQPLSGTILIS